MLWPFCTVKMKDHRERERGGGEKTKLNYVFE